MNRNFISNSNFVLRKVLNSKENLDIIQDFIETFLDISIEKIHLNPYLKSKEKYLPSEERFGIADVRVLTSKEEEINIGIQWIDGYYVINKMLLYYSQIHNNQLEHQYNKTKAKTITINILDFSYFKSKNYHQKLFIKSEPDKYGKIENLELHTIELSKFNKETLKNIDKKSAWMIYLLGENKEKIEEVLNKYEKIKRTDILIKEFWKNEKMD